VLAYYEDRLARRGVPWQDRGDDARRAGHPLRADASLAEPPRATA
jgi:hypothetical protein